ncbi:MAG: cytochrome c, partial [Planctomycetota bacterium]
GQSQTIGKKEMGFRPPAGIDPIQWRRENANRANVPIQPTQGFQDVYFIFKNPKSKGDEILMSISEIQFMNEVPAEVK